MPSQQRAPHESWVEEVYDDGIEYYFMAPDGVIYENPSDFPLQTVQKSFGDKEGLFVRFAYNKGTNTLYIQDRERMHELLSNHDPEAYEAQNRIVSWIQEAYQADMPGYGNEDGYGDPPGTVVARKLSDYNIAWNYIRKHLHSEFADDEAMRQFIEPIDINVCEYSEPDPTSGVTSDDVVSGATNVTMGGKTFHGPTLLVNKAMHKSKKFDNAPTELDYGFINWRIVSFYLANFEKITMTTLPLDKQIALKTGIMKHSGDYGYETYYAVYDSSRKKPIVIKAPNNNEEQRVLSEDEARRDIEAKIRSNHKGPPPKGPLYNGPIIIFSFLRGRNQIIFQNIHPDDSKTPQEEEMVWDIREKMAAQHGLDPDQLLESHDPSMESPVVRPISSYTAIWSYITNVLAKRKGFNPKDFDIEIIETVMSNKGALAGYVRGPAEEEELSPEAMEVRVSHGISMTYPFIMVSSQISNIGTKYHAILHEYDHYIDDRFVKTPTQHYSYTGGMSGARTPEERDRRFIEYINNPHEQSAHMEQMVYMLHLGMSEMDILDFFSGKEDWLPRAEYRRLLDKARAVYDEDRRDAPNASQPRLPRPPRTAALDIGVNDWFFMGLQELINSGGHKNEDPSKVDKPFQKVKSTPFKKPVPKTYDSMLARDHDVERAFLKTIEQLLQESRI